MHSHHGLQEQRLMAAPLIVRDPTEAGVDMQEVVVLFHDFTFRDPNEVLAELQEPAPMAGMDHSAMGHGAAAMSTGPHLQDVVYDAFLATEPNLDDPEVFRVERGGRMRLRLINGATATNFWLDLAQLEGRLIAVDGMPVEPVTGRRFEFAIAQRLDIALDLPQSEGVWPIFAVQEGERARTGFVLATLGGTLQRLASYAPAAVEQVGLALERRLQAAHPLAPREPNRRHILTITEAPGYVWMLNGAVHGAHVPLDVREGERVEITFNDQTTMAHPMHLHGHHFQVVAINGERFAGAMRDTVLIPASGSVTVAFDATNPGHWALHCHHLYHMAAGMMTTVEYQA
jgi:FtsP/CotA-like multicopper oxidase with cupredoxin domain